MKTLMTTMKGAAMTLGLGLLSLAGNAQEHITLSLENISTTKNTIEYDLFLVNDGSTSIKLASCAYGVNYDRVILNGTKATENSYGYIAGTRSEALSNLKEFTVRNTSTDRFTQLRITNTPVARNLAVELQPNVAYKVGRFKFANNANWSANSKPSLTLNEFNVPGISTSCATGYVNNNANPIGFSVAKKNLSVKVVNAENAPVVLNTEASATTGNSNSNVAAATDNNSSVKVSLYPNPTQDILHVDLTATANASTVVKVLDIHGRIVKQIQATSEKGLNPMQVSLHEVPAGVYTVQVYQNDALSFTDKVTKKN